MSSPASSRTLVSAAPCSTELLSSSLPVENDVVLSKIRIERVLGTGGMSVVYAARHELLDLPVALKVLNPEHACDEAIGRFFHEAKIAARIRSEHVCGILDVGLLDDGSPYIVMERLEGLTLGELLAMRGPLRVGEAVDLALQALEGLAHAHAAGVVHRDLKPTNLFVAMAPRRPLTVKIIDFGISKSQMLEGFTRVGSFIGSPTYAAPEQVGDAQTVDARSDIWAMGIVLYEMLSGEAPFDGDSIEVILARILYESPKPFRRADIPRALEGVIQRCLRKSREERYGNVYELAAALAPFASTPPAERLQRIAVAVARDGSRSSTPVSARPPDERRSGMRPVLTTVRLDRISPVAAVLGISPAQALALVGFALLLYAVVVGIIVWVARAHA